jgi:histone H2B
MPPKGSGAEKKPASKAPAKAPAEKKEAGKKTATTGDKKKRTKTRKETYSSYIYKGKTPFHTSGRVTNAHPTASKISKRLVIASIISDTRKNTS